MIWDDHELWDGWGSYIFKPGHKDDELHKMFPIYKEDKKELRARGLKRKDLLTLKGRMFEAAKQVYNEYQHSHNPGVPGQYDYDLSHDRKSAFYFLDGRGERNINRGKDRILGTAQLNRFKDWLKSPEVRKKKVVFVVSAVPVLHVATIVANLSELSLVKKKGLQDDLRDSWENKKHKKEREALMAALFKAADRGQRVVILSGDVHIAAAFKITNGKSVIHQLTSSAITYNIPLWESYLFSIFGVPDDGKTEEGYRFKRLALYGDSNYSLIKVDFTRGREDIEFQLYGTQSVLAPRDLPDDSRMKEVLKWFRSHFSEERSLNHSIAKIPLSFKKF
jgi:alkaline phosphatase D